jgi:hypothetical protein
MHNERTSTMKTLIIVGAGIEGVSTALAAIISYDKVYLIDNPSPSPHLKAQQESLEHPIPEMKHTDVFLPKHCNEYGVDLCLHFSTSLGDM